MSRRMSLIKASARRATAGHGKPPPAKGDGHAWKTAFKIKAAAVLSKIERRVKKPPSGRSPAEIVRDVHRVEGRKIPARYVREELLRNVKAAMADDLAMIGWYYHLRQRRPGSFSSTMKALARTDKRTRTSEGERLARDLDRLAARLAPIERDTSLQQQVWRALLIDGHFEIQTDAPDDVGFKVFSRVRQTPFFFTQVLRQIARELMDAGPASVEAPLVDLCLLDMSRCIRHYTGAARIRSSGDILLALVEAALGERPSLTPDAIKKKLQRLRDTKTLFYLPAPATSASPVRKKRSRPRPVLADGEKPRYQ